MRRDYVNADQPDLLKLSMQRGDDYSEIIKDLRNRQLSLTDIILQSQ